MSGSSVSPGPDVAGSRRLGVAGAGKYDIIVIGGGIHGAALAREAAGRGLSVLLLEQDDFGGGASANSLKIIHGGIRYLQTLNIGRLRQSVRERRELLRIAPHLVRPLRCVIPAYRRPGKGRFSLSLAARVYDLLSADRNRGLDPALHLGESRVIPLAELRALAPTLDPRDVIGGLSWWDAQVQNSERLVLAFVMSAQRCGAVVLNYVRAEAPLVVNGCVRGVVAEDRLTGERVEIEGGIVIDCSGAWAATIGKTADGHGYVKAMNLIVRRRLGECAFGARPDGHRYPDDRGLLFHAPWREGALIGTWYRCSEEPPGALTVNRQEIADALGRFNSILAGDQLEVADVLAIHLGMLPAESGGGIAQASGRFRIVDAATEGRKGLIRVHGVKYTTARAVALHVLATARDRYGLRFGADRAEGSPLYGGEIGGLDDYRRASARRHAGRLDEGTLDRLIDGYGAGLDAIMAYAQGDSGLLAPIPGVRASLRAELVYVLEHEMTHTLADLIFRRTDIGSCGEPPVETIRFCADFMARRRGWDAARVQANIDALAHQRPLWVSSVSPASD